MIWTKLQQGAGDQPGLQVFAESDADRPVSGECRHFRRFKAQARSSHAAVCQTDVTDLLRWKFVELAGRVEVTGDGGVRFGGRSVSYRVAGEKTRPPGEKKERRPNGTTGGFVETAGSPLIAIPIATPGPAPVPRPSGS